MPAEQTASHLHARQHLLAQRPVQWPIHASLCLWHGWLTACPSCRGPFIGQMLKRVKMALAASMSANNVSTDPRSIAVVSVFYHLVDFSSDEGLLVSLQPKIQHHAVHLA